MVDAARLAAVGAEFAAFQASRGWRVGQATLLGRRGMLHELSYASGARRPEPGAAEREQSLTADEGEGDEVVGAAEEEEGGAGEEGEGHASEDAGDGEDGATGRGQSLTPGDDGGLAAGGEGGGAARESAGEDVPSAQGEWG